MYSIQYICTCRELSQTEISQQDLYFFLTHTNRNELTEIRDGQHCLHLRHVYSFCGTESVAFQCHLYFNISLRVQSRYKRDFPRDTDSPLLLNVGVLTNFVLRICYY